MGDGLVSMYTKTIIFLVTSAWLDMCHDSDKPMAFFQLSKTKTAINIKNNHIMYLALFGFSLIHPHSLL